MHFSWVLSLLTHHQSCFKHIPRSYIRLLFIACNYTNYSEIQHIPTALFNTLEGILREILTIDHFYD